MWVRVCVERRGGGLHDIRANAWSDSDRSDESEREVGGECGGLMMVGVKLRVDAVLNHYINGKHAGGGMIGTNKLHKPQHRARCTYFVLYGLLF